MIKEIPQGATHQSGTEEYPIYWAQISTRYSHSEDKGTWWMWFPGLEEWIEICEERPVDLEDL